MDSPDHQILEIYLLGSLQIKLDKVAVTGFVSNKAKALFGYLALNQRPIERDSLVGLLWGEMPEPEAKANLRVALSNLRKLLGPYLIINRQTAAFNQDTSYRLDVEALLNRLSTSPDRASMADLEAAVQIYQGDFLADLYLRNAPDFEEWLLTQRERLRALVVQALHRLINHYTEQGAKGRDKAIDYISRLLAIDPWYEAAYRRLMQLLARQGLYSAALAQYQTCCKVLAEGLGVEPMPETTALAERIRLARQLPRHNLPQPTTPFVGRQAELAEIESRLLDPNIRLLTLVGLGGVGKTRLALQAAEAQVGNFLEGVHFISLTATGDPAALPAIIGDALGLALSGGSSTRQLLNYLQLRELLLVLDSFEQLRVADRCSSFTGPDFLSNILSRAPAVKLLVTSRRRLNLPEEWVLEVAGLPTPIKDSADAESYSAVQLYIQSARRVRSNFKLTSTDRPAVIQICRLLEGLPLGIELAASWERVLSGPELLAELEHSFQVLNRKHPDVSPRHRSLRAVFDQSWLLLSAEEQAAFRKLSVFRGGFRRSGVSQVIDASLDVLAALVDKSFVRRSEGGRYETHAMLGQFGAEELARFPEEARQVRTAHSRYYATWLAEKESQLSSSEQQTSLVEISLELENIRVGWQWAAAQADWPTLDRYIPGLYRYYKMRSRFVEGLQLFTQAITELRSRPGSLDSRILGRLVARQGVFLFSLGKLDQAQPLLEEGLQQARLSENQAEIAFVTFFLACVIHDRGDYDQADILYRQSLAFFEAQNDRSGIALVINNLGITAWKQGHNAEARRLYEESLRLSRELGDRRRVASLLNNLALIAKAEDQPHEARQLLEEALVSRRDLGDRFGVGLALTNLGLLALDGKDYDTAWRFYQEGLAVCRDIGDRWGEADALAHLGHIAVRRGQADQPETGRYFQQALLVAQEMQSEAVLLEVLLNMGEWLALTGQAELAVAILTMINQHPAFPGHLRPQARELSATFETTLTSVLLTSGQVKGQSLTLQEVANKLLKRKVLNLTP